MELRGCLSIAVGTVGNHNFSMPGCVLHVVGKGLIPELVLPQVKLKPYLKFRAGDMMFGRVADKGGFRCSVSSSDGILSQEIIDAIAVLVEYETDLRNIHSEACVEEMSLDFGYYLRIDGEKIIFQNDFLPSELLRLCGSLGIGIHLSLYPPPNEKTTINNSRS